MSDESKLVEDDSSPLFSEYGQLVLLLDAQPSTLREAIKDASQEQKRRIIGVLEDQLNDTPIKGNEKLFKRYLYLWMFTIRQLDEGSVDNNDVENFKLDFVEWEYNQFY